MSPAVNQITKQIAPPLTRVFNAIRKPEIWKKATNAFMEEDAVQTFALVSGISKDAINCIYYVTQSATNEKIPEDKRPFVASLDLSNGLLNVTLQAAIGYYVKKYNGTLFDNYIGKKIKVNKTIAKNGFGVLVTLVATQILTKRVLVPFIATPMASMFKKNFEAKKKTQAANGDTVEIKKDDQSAKRAMVDSTTPASAISNDAKATTNLLDMQLSKTAKK